MSNGPNGPGSQSRNERLIIERRRDLMALVREFFDARGFLEVDTPIRVTAPALEEHIDAVPSGKDAWLRTSPELHMKRLLANGHEKIYQLSPCFRSGEHGERHREEFTMLEWYRANTDYLGIMADTKALISFISDRLLQRQALQYQGRAIELVPNWDCLSVRDAFIEFAGWDPFQHWDADRFDLDMVNKVEPSLPLDHPVILKDYPVQSAALARISGENPPFAERWELYIGGLELANAYSELVNAREQRERFEACISARKAADKPIYPLDNAFLEALEQGMPPSGGIALGIDRLLMLLNDTADIADTRLF